MKLRMRALGHLAALAWTLLACNVSLFGTPQPTTPPAAPQAVASHHEQPPVEFHADGSPVCARGPGGQPINPPGHDRCVPSTEYLQGQVTSRSDVPLLDAAEYTKRLQEAVAAEEWGFAAVALLELRLVDPGNPLICTTEAPVRAGLQAKAIEHQRELIRQAEQRAADKQAFIEQQEALRTPQGDAQEALRRGLEALESGDQQWWIQMNIASPEQLADRGELMEAMALDNPQGRRLRLGRWSSAAGIDPATRYPGLPVHLVLACLESEAGIASLNRDGSAAALGADVMAGLSSNHAALCVPQREPVRCP